ncbi:MAG: hypothetical protein LBH00_02555, partial [Planctomycetaceae bacterium]|nr:hypothetical protein [Planctomycetaceae bacterium]
MFKKRCLRGAVIVITSVVVLLLVFLACRFYIAKQRANAVLNHQIKKAMTCVEYIIEQENKSNDGQKNKQGSVNLYLYDEVLPSLQEATVKSLRKPVIATAKVSHYKQDDGYGPESFSIQIGWLEAKPAADGIRIRIDREKFDLPFTRNPSSSFNDFDDWFIVYGYTVIQISDIHRDKWNGIIDALKDGQVNVALTREGRVVSGEHILKIVPPPLTLSGRKTQ